MRPADMPGAVNYGGPGWDNLPVLRAHDGTNDVLVSAWELDEDEMEEINRTGRVWLIVQGTAQPPVALRISSPFPPHVPESDE